ncbi:cytokine receptor-like [Drosophila ficusphila]|uniref:cytokine receptor-like n=1 Tax=Drosophila ficusphila TaxID=30025 RepID=UPI001C89ED2C|nr:cytokine receptor-like [Drosophila ficusphila]
MEGELTGLLLVFLMPLISICGAQKVCDVDIWSSNKTLYAGGAHDVFCRCNHPDVRPEDLHLRTFSVLPLLEVSDLKCHRQERSRNVTCGFSRIGDPRFWKDHRYSVSVNGEQAVGCRETPENKTWMQCLDIDLHYADYFVQSHNLSLQLEGNGKTQLQQFQINLNQITVPAWPTESPILETTEEKICLHWENWVDTGRDMKCLIQLLLRKRRIDPQWPKVESQAKNRWSLCFDTPSLSNQIYDARVWCRFDKPIGPFTDDHYPFTFTTPASPPKHAPKIVPNGFFHDADEEKLYVFWIPLTELQFNGPNFTYIVQTQSGKTAFLLSNNTAVFQDWDATHSSIVYVWSQNSRGPSANKSQLEVPVLTHERSRQPQELVYHADNLTITWQPPEYQNDLIGYIVTWCSASANSSQICDDLRPINYRVLEGSQNCFHFNSSVVFSNVAVAARYKDNSGGGMQWKDPKENSFRRRWGYYLGSVLFLLTLFLVLISIHNFRKMSDTAVSVQQSNPPAETAVPGSGAIKTIVEPSSNVEFG